MELKLKVSRNTDYDVIVAGGGPAGCCAAAAAAREGAKVLLIEAAYSLGGMGASGLVPAWCPFSDGINIIYKGFAERIFKENKREIPFVSEKHVDWVPIDAEKLKRQFDSLVQEYGASILFGSTVLSVEMKDRKITGIIVGNKAGLTLYRAKVYVDCTGDGDLAASAGAPFEKGGGKGEVQPSTLCMLMSGVDTDAYKKIGPGLHAGSKGSPAYDMKDDADFPYINDLHLCNSIVGHGTVGFNAGHVQVDPNDPFDLSDAMIRGRRTAYDYLRAVRKYHPAFKNAYLAATGALLGVRESRRILGDYYLTVDDYFARKDFEDGIARNCYYIDIHDTTKENNARWVNGVFIKPFEKYKPGESHGIPYRCLIPRGIQNLLVAGRCISTDRIVQGSTRVMPPAMVLGEAAGTAAAMAVKTKDVRAIDIKKLKEKLTDYGNCI